MIRATHLPTLRESFKPNRFDFFHRALSSLPSFDQQIGHLVFVSSNSHSALGHSTKSLAIGAVVDQIGSKNAEPRDQDGLKISINAEKIIPFQIPAGILRSASKSVGRWPEYGSNKSYFTQPGHRGGMSLFADGTADLKHENSPSLSMMPALDFEPDLFLILSDSAPHEYLRYLDSYYPKSKKVYINGIKCSLNN